MEEATRTDAELALFAAWFSEKRLPMDYNQLAEFDSVSKSLHAQWERFSLREGVLYRQHWDNSGNKDMWQILLPVRYRQEAMYSAHQSVSGGHMGVKKTQLKLTMKAYWVGWTVDVRDFCKMCDQCARYHRGGVGGVKEQGELQPMCVGEPWERMAIDITGPHLVSSKGNKFIITIIDHFTKFAFAFPVRAHDATTVAKYFVDRLFLTYGIPLQLLSDKGAEFEGSIFKEVCSMLGVDKIRTTSYKPSTNGALERMHRTLNTMIGKVVDDKQKDWDAHVAYVMAAYNATVHSSTGVTPNPLMYGRELRFPNELMYVEVEDKVMEEHNYSDFVEGQRVGVKACF